MEYNYMSFLTDFCFMSLLLVIAQFMRAKIKFLQMFYIPASLVAGILGLLLGPQFLDLIPWSGQIGSYAYMLVCVLFGGLFLGKKEKTSVKRFSPRWAIPSASIWVRSSSASALLCWWAARWSRSCSRTSLQKSPC